MSTTIFLMVLAAAALHASWNALVKGGGDKEVSMLAVVLGQGLFGVLALPFDSTPAAAAIPWILASVGLHVGYQYFLQSAYRIGDLTQVYPIARGSAPLIVAVVSVGALGVALSGLEMLAVVVIAAGVMSLSLSARGGGANGKAAAFALATGCFIAAYSLCDGLGARIAGASVGYYGWVAGLNAVVFAVLAGLRRPSVVTGAFRAWKTLLIGGGASFIAYALVVYAFTEAPIALVTALRETSIIFALLIGMFGLKERVNIAKAASIFATVFGAALLKLAKG